MGRSARLLPSYGVHWADGVAFLIQRSGITNALGVDFPSPFSIYDKVVCPHDIKIPDSGVRHPQSGDPLFKAMSPIPGAGLFIVQKPVALIRQLEELCSPIEPLSLPYWQMTPNQIRQATLWTNCAPLIFTGFTLRDVRHIQRLSDLTKTGPRRVILVAEEPLPRDDRFEVIRTEITSVEEPHLLRRAGAALLTSYMLGGPQLPNP